MFSPAQGTGASALAHDNPSGAGNTRPDVGERTQVLGAIHGGYGLGSKIDTTQLVAIATSSQCPQWHCLYVFIKCRLPSSRNGIAFRLGHRDTMFDADKAHRDPPYLLTTLLSRSVANASLRAGDGVDSNFFPSNTAGPIVISNSSVLVRVALTNVPLGFTFTLTIFKEGLALAPASTSKVT